MIVVVVVVVLVDKVEFEARGQHRMVVRPTSAKIARIDRDSMLLSALMVCIVLYLITYSTYVQ
jgi:hypothetical protein